MPGVRARERENRGSRERWVRRNRDIDANLPGRTISSQSRAEPRANIVFTRTHGFCGANNLVLLHLLHVCAGETLRQLPSPAASASLSQCSSRRISISVRTNVNAAYCVVVPPNLTRRCDYSVSCVLYYRTRVCFINLSTYLYVYLYFSALFLIACNCCN